MNGELVCGAARLDLSFNNTNLTASMLQVACILVQECLNANNMLISTADSVQSVPSKVSRHWKAMAAFGQCRKVRLVADGDFVWCLSPFVLDAQRSAASRHQLVPDVLDGCLC